MSRHDRKFADQLTVDDLAFLGVRYNMAEEFLSAFTDGEWAEFLGCSIEELPFYLFDESAFDKYLADSAFERVDPTVGFDDFDPDNPYDHDHPDNGRFDLSDYLERQYQQELAEGRIAVDGVNLTPWTGTSKGKKKFVDITSMNDVRLGDRVYHKKKAMWGKVTGIEAAKLTVTVKFDGRKNPSRINISFGNLQRTLRKKNKSSVIDIGAVREAKAGASYSPTTMAWPKYGPKRRTYVITHHVEIVK